MLHKTKGIVIKYIKYGDSSIIVNIFTEEFGLQTYIVNGARSKKSKGKIALYQPLTLLDMVVYHKEQSSIHRISEVKCSQPFISISTDIKKSCIALFLTEVIHKTIKEQEDIQALFTFLHQSILILDYLEGGYENFHLQFMLKLTQYLGFGAEKIEDSELSLMLNRDELDSCNMLYQTSFDTPIKITYARRQLLLQCLIDYYQNHMDNFGVIKSVEILSEVLHD
jgi:DNA repair protein RecO (recombination protein O)